MIRSWLAHPLTRGLDLDAPETTALWRRIIREKELLAEIYREWYREISASLPVGDGAVVELGSGAGFFDEIVSDAITSDILRVPGIDLVADALELPFCSGSLRAVVMTNMLHHLHEPGRLLLEAARCVRPGGVLSMIEPWVSPWSRFAYRAFHHEPFDPTAPAPRSEPGGPLSGANGALPWIIFYRDRERLSKEFPQWRLVWVHPMMPFRYVLSGGVSLRSLMPDWTFRAWTQLEHSLESAMYALAMFAHVVLRRIESPVVSER